MTFGQSTLSWLGLVFLGEDLNILAEISDIKWLST
jgi:hypothetical protein